jgi:signal transduction histidine kinase/ligand-binding sensor domain-containing protein/CheY-like chemotaxis protein/AraC-like DNA-binding protein
MNFLIKISFRVVLLLVIFIKGGFAQSKCKIEHFSTEDGLSHDWVTCILKDKEGFMWFGTWNGINRFDGHSFVSYKSSPGDMSQLKSDRIDQIVEDETNHLWLKAYDGNIYRFDKGSEQFFPLSNVIKTSDKKRIAFDRIYKTNNGDIWLITVNEGLLYFPKWDTTLLHFVRYRKESLNGFYLPSNKINLVREDKEHNIWVGTSDGLVLLSRSADSYKTIPLGVVTKNLTVSSFAEDTHQLYFGTKQGQLIIYNKYKKSFHLSKLTPNELNNLIVSKKSGYIYGTTSAGELLTFNPKTEKVIFSGVTPSGGSLHYIFEDSGGCLWLAPEKQGVVRFNPQTNSFQYLSQTNNAIHNNSDGHYHVFEDNDGVVWVSMKGGGFGYYNASSGKIDYFYNEPGNPNRQLSNTIIDLYYDKAGVLWLNTDEKGIDKVSLLPGEFSQHLLVEPANFKTDNEVRGILCDKEGRLWVGAKSGKLYIYQNGKPVTGLFIDEPKDGFGQVYTIMQDSRGNIWLGTKNNGLFKARPIDQKGTKYQLTHFLYDKNDASSLSSNEVYTVLEDKKGNIWVGTYDAGLNLLVASDSSVKFIRAGSSVIQYPKGAFNKIRNMTLDGWGNIWIATTDGLLVLGEDRTRPSNYKYATYSKIPGDKESLGNNDIQYIYRDSRNMMWLATSGGGLDQAIGDQPFRSIRFKDYTTKDGLPNDYILSLTEDKSGNLWVATQNGLSKFDVRKKQFTNYDSYDGLPKIIFSEASCTRLPNYDIAFGTGKGYLLFNPIAITDHKTTAKLVFTNLQINNKDVNNSDDDKILSANINYVPELKLLHDQNTISVDYTVLDPRSGLKTNYAYRLRGLDTGWRDNKNQRRATYTNLPPGNYTLEVKSTSTNIFTQLPYRNLKITVFPPPWRTWWAYVLYSILIIIITVIIIRTALTMLRLRHNIAVEKRMAALKLSFFTNVSHELRTPLTLILNPIEEIEKILIREKISYQGSEYINVVKKNANRMVRFINQLLDLRKAESGKTTLKISQVEVVSLVKNIGEYFKDVAHEKEIDLQIVSDLNELFAWIDAEKLDIVIYNVLANAFKFTPPGKKIMIQIAQDLKQGNLSVTIADQGKGVAPSDLLNIFELYYEGEHADGNNLKGTGIGLALSKELIELHHGKISAHNNSDNGLTVTVELMLDKNHFSGDNVIFINEPLIEHELERTIESSLLSAPVGIAPQGENVPLVLLVEDNSELRRFLEIQLSELYRIETAENGAEGLRKATEMLPDLILSDVMMPVMNGIEMLEHLKNNSATSHIPVVILSAKSSLENQIEGLKYGADYYITKPFNNAFLLASIENLLEKRKKIFEKLLTDKKVVHLGPGEIAITSYDESFLIKIIEIVEENIGDPDFNIDAVADSMNMSRSPFYKKFKSLTNLAPVEFVREMRLKRAKQFFDAGQTKIADIAFLVGFGNSKYFSTCFKEQFGVTPSEYLKSKETPRVV